MSDWQETKAVLQQLEILFSRDDDVKDLIELIQIEKELGLLYTAKSKSFKDIIQGLSSAVEKKSLDLIPPSQEEHEKLLKKLQEENLTSYHDNLLKKIDEKDKEINQNSENLQNLEKESIKLEENSPLNDNISIHSFALYQKITNILWDYKNSNDDILYGVIGNEITKEFNNFSVNLNQSDYKVSQDLWNMIYQCNDV